MNRTTYKVFAIILAIMSIVSLVTIIRDVSDGNFRISELLTCLALAFLSFVAFLTSKFSEKIWREKLEEEKRNAPAPREIYKRIGWIALAHVAIIGVFMIITIWKKN